MRTEVDLRSGCDADVIEALCGDLIIDTWDSYDESQFVVKIDKYIAKMIYDKVKERIDK